jgi:hypothetical protein
MLGWLIDWCETPILAVFQLYRGIQILAEHYSVSLQLACVKRSLNSRYKSKCILLPKQNSVTGQKIGKHSLRCTIKSLKLSAEIYPYRDFRVCGCRSYITIGSEKLFPKISYVIVQIFQRILTLVYIQSVVPILEQCG